MDQTLYDKSDNHQQDLIFNCLGVIYINFKRSEIAYRQYMNEGKIFLYARILKQCNKTIRKCLLQYAHLLPTSLHQDAVLLITHYDVWMAKWIALEKSSNPKIDDEFIFQNNITFPKEAAQNIEKAFLLMVTKT